MENNAMDAHTRHTDTSRIALLIWLLAIGVFILHFPGQATYDTLAQAYDGATRIYTSNQPPAMSLLLSMLTLPGVLALQIALFSVAAWRVLTLSGCALKAQYWLTLFLFLYPILFIYMGTVWKDVLFAHGAVLAILLLPAAAPHKHIRALALSAAILSVAVAVRQQAILVAVVAVLYLLGAAGAAGFRRRARWLAALSWIAVFGLCSLAIKTGVQASGNTAGAVAYQGPIRQLAMFDLGGIMHRVPDLEFPAIAARARTVPVEHRPTRERVVEQLRRYSPQRQDFMQEADTPPPMWILPDTWLLDWRANVRRYPGAYLAHRLDATAWLLGFHDPEQCVPFAVGIAAEPRHMLDALGAAPGMSNRAELLHMIGLSALPLFRPWLYIGLALATTAYLAANGARKHALVIALQIGGLLYAGSYFFIGFACDFRYTYFTTISALFGAAYAIGVSLRSRVTAQGRENVLASDSR